MKHALLIAFACVSSLFSQTGPPALKCLEVAGNGNVILHWLPAADANNTFVRYEVLSGISKAGPFNVVVPSITPVSTPTAVHASTVALAQTIYYFVRTVRKDSSRSAHSDTLNTIFLNVLVADPALNITFNHLRQPPLPSAASFTVLKEYPIGTVNSATVTKALQYQDVISVCKAKINYQVVQSNSSGCVSRSNMIFGEYSDTKYPDSVYVDSISVLPDGRTVLSWSPSFDMDVDSYYVIKQITASPPYNQYISQIAGRNNTTFYFNDTEANETGVFLFIQAVDSCGKRGPFDERPVTMHVNAEYDQCRYLTRLDWNDYEGMKKGIKEYRIFCSVDNGPYVLAGASNNSEFVHTDVPPETSLSYFIRVVNGDESITASSNRIRFFSRQVAVPALNYIVRAHVNRNQHVELNIAIDPNIVFAALDIERSEEPFSGFKNIKTLPFAAIPQYGITDTSAQTGARPYYYRSVIRDSCGNARNVSNICRTIHLQVSAAGENTYERTLTWTAYQGYGEGVQAYNIYRIVNGDGAPPVLATTTSFVNSYTDDMINVAAEGSSVAYMVEAVEQAGGAFRGFSSSNMVPVYVEGRIYVPNAFVPAGVNSTWKPVTHFVSQEEYRLKVFNRWGQEIFHASDFDQAWDGGNHEEGVYVYLITYKNARGEYRQQKGTVMLVR